ncbi:hypothetical protein JZO70_03665 [Enterococcus sp. 669A]|uniref:Uncharacterized protein n=1 Tax=Candidatus Enterococcus moelleringii TaxID=2815325 RepID=A0ABS3L6J6_9ENTE|nr:hypothetical protein [Enterococcus sp. 669A]MBO1305244.1 hypothetical protein [Enterococcus sp. 669A]
MKAKPLGSRQIYGMKRESLLKRFSQFGNQSKDKVYLIQCAVAVMIRNCFSVENFSSFAEEIICPLFLEGTREELAEIRHLCPYFENYFEKEEWQKIVAKLFANQQEYLQITETARSTIEMLGHRLYSGAYQLEKKYNLKTAFSDAAGSIHSWSLSNVVPHPDPLENQAVLAIFDQLTIFKKEDGTRRFTRAIWLDFAVDEKFRAFDTRKEDDPTYVPKETDLPEEVEAVESKQSSEVANTPSTGMTKTVNQTAGTDAAANRKTAAETGKPTKNDASPPPVEKGSQEKKPDASEEEGRRPDAKYKDLLKPGKKGKNKGQNNQKQQPAYSKKNTSKKNRHRKKRK